MRARREEVHKLRRSVSLRNLVRKPSNSTVLIRSGDDQRELQIIQLRRPPQLAASFLTRSGAATHRSEASHPPPVSFLFWRGSGSGCTLFLSPHGIVAVIGVGNAGRAPANPRTDGAAHARASPFPTNRAFRETTCGGSSTSAQGSPRHSAGHRARSPCSQSPPSRDSFSHDRVAGLRRATSAKRSSIAMAIYRLLKNCTLEPKEVSRITEAYEQALHVLCVKDRDDP